MNGPRLAASARRARVGGRRADAALRFGRPGYDARMSRPHRSIFTPATSSERDRNFEDYLAFTLRQDGDLLVAEKDLATKRARLEEFRAHPVRARRPLADPERFYRNSVAWQDDPASADRKTLLLTCLYKVARH